MSRRHKVTHVLRPHRSALAEAGIQPSVGAVGSSYDNALAETIIGLYNTELIHQGKPWKTVEDVEMATARWVNWFNNDRI